MAVKVERSLRDRFQKSFLERNTKVIGAIAISILLGLTVLGLLLQGGLLTKRYSVQAIFADAAGIRTGDRVTVAGLSAGRVNGVKIEGGHVVMDLGVNSGVELTRDSSAEIHIETLLGRRSVQLVDGTSSQKLESGDVIPLSQTETPVDVTDLNDISVNLLQKSDAGALNQLMREVTDITQGKAGQIRTIIDGLTKITSAVDERRAQLGQLLDALRTLSTTLGDRDQTIVSLIDNLNVVLGNLAQRQQDLATLLQATDSASHETANLVVRNRGALDSTLSYLHKDLEILSRHQLDLAATVSYLEQSVKGYSSVGYSAGEFPNHWANIFVQSLGPAGVDALIGPCGAVAHFFDQFFGTKCGKTSLHPIAAPQGPTGAAGAGAGGLGVPKLPIPNPDLKLPPLPCTVNDLVSSVLGETMACDGR